MGETVQARPRPLNIRAIPWLPCSALALVLYDCYVPGYGPCLALGFFMWFGIALYYIVRFVLELLWIIPRRRHFQRATVALFCLSVLATSPYPKSLAFMASLPALEHFVATREPKFVAFRFPDFRVKHKILAQVGLFRIFDWMVGADGTVYLVTAYSSVGRVGISGFAFHKPSLVDFYKIGTLKAKPIVGDWYEFEYFIIYYNGRCL